MVYLRNVSRLDQSVVDLSGSMQKVEADGVVQVTVETAEGMLREAPSVWARVIAIAPPPPGKG